MLDRPTTVETASGLLSFLWLAVRAVGAVAAERATRLGDTARVSLLLRQSQGPIFVLRPLGRYLCICHS